jgi:hypothetical protein
MLISTNFLSLVSCPEEKRRKRPIPSKVPFIWKKRKNSKLIKLRQFYSSIRRQHRFMPSPKRVFDNFTAVFFRFFWFSEEIKLVQSKNWIFEGLLNFQIKRLLAKIVKKNLMRKSGAGIHSTYCKLCVKDLQTLDFVWKHPWVF